MLALFGAALRLDILSDYDFFTFGLSGWSKTFSGSFSVGVSKFDLKPLGEQLLHFNKSSHRDELGFFREFAIRVLFFEVAVARDVLNDINDDEPLGI